MPTTYIALQCFQCSTMQVKQQKKSSNKWSCVVCNEKQSVRKVFAQGFMAKDVRKFVQNFNMSRQLSDQKQLLEENEPEPKPETSNSPVDEHNKPKRRNDWTEYVDDDHDELPGKFNQDENIAQGDSGFEPIVVTELPKALFKRPKLKDYSSRGDGPERLLKPLFLNRSHSKKHKSDHSQDTHCTQFELTSCGTASERSHHLKAFDVCSNEEAIGLHPSDRASKWNSFRAQIHDRNSNVANVEKPFARQPAKGALNGSISKWSCYIAEDDDEQENEMPIEGRNQATTETKGPVSKWSSFLTEEDDVDSLESRGRRESWDNFDRPSYDPLESLKNAERVEDDIHPDFL